MLHASAKSNGTLRLTEIGVLYWRHVGELFGWSSKTDYRPCPLHKTYQLVRNVLAACVDDHGKLHTDRGHALVIYDQRNPAMARDGACDRQWQAAYEALQARSTLRRLSWQAFIAQWPGDPVLNWLKEELAAKYGLHPS
jgi:Restriction Endonuclease associating with ARP